MNKLILLGLLAVGACTSPQQAAYDADRAASLARFQAMKQPAPPSAATMARVTELSAKCGPGCASYVVEPTFGPVEVVTVPTYRWSPPYLAKYGQWTPTTTQVVVGRP